LEYKLTILPALAIANSHLGSQRISFFSGDQGDRKRDRSRILDFRLFSSFRLLKQSEGQISYNSIKGVYKITLATAGVVVVELQAPACPGAPGAHLPPLLMAALIASVSSVIPSPFAPNAVTLRKI
jgi:hypothetical protein